MPAASLPPPAGTMIDVLLADDQEMVRTGIRLIIESEDDMRVVGEAVDGREAVDRARLLRPDVVLMDIQMPLLDGIEATRLLMREDEPPRVLVLTTFERDDYIGAALHAGASGFMLKNAPPDELVSGIRTIADGEGMLSPEVTRRLIERFAEQGLVERRDDLLEPLTEREREVLLLVARGMTNREIAAAFVVSEATVKTHVSRVLAKLRLRDRVQAVVFAYEAGLIRPGDAAFDSE